MTKINMMYILLGAVIGSFSQVAMTVGMQREKSATASAMRMSDVVFSFLMEFFFTQDHVNLLSIIGATLVTSSVLLIVYFKRRSDLSEKKKLSHRDDMNNDDEEDGVVGNPMNTNSTSVNNNLEIMSTSRTADKMHKEYKLIQVNSNTSRS